MPSFQDPQQLAQGWAEFQELYSGVSDRIAFGATIVIMCLLLWSLLTALIRLLGRSMCHARKLIGEGILPPKNEYMRVYDVLDMFETRDSHDLIYLRRRLIRMTLKIDSWDGPTYMKFSDERGRLEENLEKVRMARYLLEQAIQRENPRG